MSHGVSTKTESFKADSKIHEFQAIATIFQLSFEKLLSLGDSFDVIVRSIAVSLVSSIPHECGDVSVQLMRILDWRTSLILSRRHAISNFAQFQTFESAHPYSNSSNVSHIIHFPGASCIRIVFDTSCKTEINHDFLQFRQASAIVGEHKYHGRRCIDPDANWRPLVVQGERLEASFISDDNVNDWGYKFTATAISEYHWVQFDAVCDNLMYLLDCSLASLLESNGLYTVPPCCLKALGNGPVSQDSTVATSSQPSSIVCVDACNKHGRWFQAFIVSGSAFGANETQSVIIHFMGWDSEHDEEIPQGKYDSHIRFRSSCEVGPNGQESIEDVSKKYPHSGTKVYAADSNADVIDLDPFSQCCQALESLLLLPYPSCSRYRSCIARSISKAVLDDDLHPLLLVCARKFLDNMLSDATFSAMTDVSGFVCENLHYHTVLSPWLASVIAATSAPPSCFDVSGPIASHLSNLINVGIDRIISILALYNTEAFIRLVPAIEITAIILMRSQLSCACINTLLEEIKCYMRGLLTSNSDRMEAHPKNVEILFITLLSNPASSQRLLDHAPAPRFEWNSSQWSLLSLGAVSAVTSGSSLSVTPINGLPSKLSSRPAYLFSSLPLDVYTRATGHAFEISVTYGIECIGLTMLTPAEFHVCPFLIEDSCRSYTLQFSSHDSRMNLTHDGKLIAVLPDSFSHLVPTVSVLYNPSSRTATFGVTCVLSKWSHTFEGLPPTEVFLFVKLRGTGKTKTIMWNIVDEVHQSTTDVSK
jgi:hypothetical protein